MIRIWKGIERELSNAVPTMYVCSSNPVTSNIIIDLLEKNPDIQAVYFGAGEREFKAPTSKEWYNIQTYCKARDIHITVEVNHVVLPYASYLFVDPSISVLVTLRSYKHLRNVDFKVVDNDSTRVYSLNKVITEKRCRDRYSNDIILYEEDYE